MKTSLICFLVLVLGLQVAAGLSFLKRIQNARKQERKNAKSQAFALREEMFNELKAQIKMELDDLDSRCPDNGELPDCSAVESDIDDSNDSIYTYQGALELLAEEVEAKDNEMKETLKSQGLSFQEINCKMYSCVLMNMYQRSTNNETIQVCEVNKCVFKRGLDLRNMKHLQNDRVAKRTLSKVLVLELFYEELHYQALDKTGSSEENNVGDESDSLEHNGSNKDRETWPGPLQGMCFTEDMVQNCQDKDNDECATILANDMIATNQQCFAEGNIKKKAVKETIVDKLKRMVAEKEAEAHRERVLKRLLSELNL